MASIKVTKKEETFRKKRFPDIEQIKECKLTCTVCFKNIGPKIIAGLSCFRHLKLEVLVCKECKSFYGDGVFSQDEDGDEKYCRWCGQGGKLFFCDKCSGAFCSTCVKRNFSRDILKDIQSKDSWDCFICNPEPLYDLRAQAWAANELYTKLMKKPKSKSLSKRSFNPDETVKDDSNVPRKCTRREKIKDDSSNKPNSDNSNSSKELFRSEKKVAKLGRKLIFEVLDDFLKYSTDVVQTVTKIKKKCSSKTVSNPESYFKLSKKLDDLFIQCQENISVYIKQLAERNDYFKKGIESANKSARSSKNNGVEQLNDSDKEKSEENVSDSDLQILDKKSHQEIDDDNENAEKVRDIEDLEIDKGSKEDKVCTDSKKNNKSSKVDSADSSSKCNLEVVEVSNKEDKINKPLDNLSNSKDASSDASCEEIKPNETNEDNSYLKDSMNLSFISMENAPNETKTEDTVEKNDEDSDTSHSENDKKLDNSVSNIINDSLDDSLCDEKSNESKKSKKDVKPESSPKNTDDEDDIEERATDLKNNKKRISRSKDNEGGNSSEEDKKNDGTDEEPPSKRKKINSEDNDNQKSVIDVISDSSNEGL